MKKKIIFLIIIFFILFNFNKAISEIFIKAKINGQIITNIDIKKEKGYLLALNPNLKNLPEENVNRYAIDSLINERVKKIEIEQKYQILINENVVKKVIEDLYGKIGISNSDSFNEYLKTFDINLDLVKQKISVEIAWNDYIVKKFNKAILVDEEKIRNKIKRLNEQNIVEHILLSEIIFTINENEILENKFQEIKKSINKIGFEESAKIYSVSDSKKNGGKIGWVYKTQLSKKISGELDKVNIGDITKPISTPGGFILLMLNDRENKLLEIDEEEQFKKAMNFEKNRQLTMYSTLHYKRVYNKTVINEF